MVTVAADMQHLSVNRCNSFTHKNLCHTRSAEGIVHKSGRSPNRADESVTWQERIQRPAHLRTCESSQSPQRTQSMRYSKNAPRPTVMRRTYTTKQVERTRGSSEPVKEFRDRTYSSPRQFRQDVEFYPIQKRISPTESEDVMRMRTFTIDSKGYLINRGDSFRCRSNTAGSGSVPCSNNSKSSSTYSSRCQSPLPAEPASNLSPSPDTPKYNILVLGIEAVGKSSVINQFMTSEFCTLYNSEYIERPLQNTISVMLDGEESELTFIEVDTLKNDLWESLSGSGYLVVYSVDDEMSFKCAKEILYKLREQKHTALKPIVLVGNKADLERRRFVTSEDGKLAAKENDCKFVEVSVALGHNVDELLAGILAQIKLKHSDNHVKPEKHSKLKKLRSKSKLAPSKSNTTTTTCTNLSHAGRSLVSKLLKKKPSKSVEDLFQG